MYPPTRRLAVQYLFLAIVGFLVVNIGCYWYGGSSWGGSQWFNLSINHRSAPQAGTGIVDQWHDFKAEQVKTTTKGVGFFRQWLNGNMAFAIRVPQSDDGSEPGRVGQSGNIILLVGPDANHTKRLDITLRRNDALAGDVEALLPTDARHRWQVLEPADYGFLQKVPDNVGHMEGTFYYRLEFGGTDRCNGCTLQLAFCARNMGNLPTLAAPALRTKLVQGARLSCTQPQTAYILLEDPGVPPPAVVAAFGFYGGRFISQNKAGSIAIPVRLSHTDTKSLTFDLASVRSARGWTYTWYNGSGTTPVSQINVPPANPHTEQPPNLTLKVTVPPCTSATDLIQLRAHANGGIVAEGYTYVVVYPDSSKCSLLDVGVGHTADSSRVAAGSAITLTITVTNYETSEVGAVFTDTLSPADAIVSVTSGNECAWQSPHLVCQVPSISAQGTHQVLATLTTSSRFTGTVESLVQVQPMAGTDAEGYDNTSGPLTIEVYRTRVYDLYLPILRKAQSPH